MIHRMKLNESPFERIKNGTKTVEFRLYDEKRRTIQIGDEIEFSKLPELQEKLLVKVIDLYKEESFEKLFKKVFVGEDKEKIIENGEIIVRKLAHLSIYTLVSCANIVIEFLCCKGSGTYILGLNAKLRFLYQILRLYELQKDR